MTRPPRRARTPRDSRRTTLSRPSGGARRRRRSAAGVSAVSQPRRRIPAPPRREDLSASTSAGGPSATMHPIGSAPGLPLERRNHVVGDEQDPAPPTPPAQERTGVINGGSPSPRRLVEEEDRQTRDGDAASATRCLWPTLRSRGYVSACPAKPSRRVVPPARRQAGRRQRAQRGSVLADRLGKNRSSGCWGGSPPAGRYRRRAARIERPSMSTRPPPGAKPTSAQGVVPGRSTHQRDEFARPDGEVRRAAPAPSRRRTSARAPRADQRSVLRRGGAAAVSPSAPIGRW